APSWPNGCARGGTTDQTAGDSLHADLQPFTVHFEYRCISRPHRKEGSMKKARSQKGSLCLSVNGSGTQVWIFRWWETSTDGRRVRRKRQVGTLEQYKTEEAAEKAARNWRLVLRANQDGVVSRITMKALIDHFREKELVDRGEEGRAWSTRDRYEAYLNSWIEPRWGKEELTAIRAPLVEEWLRNLRQKPRKRKLPQLTA